MDIESLERLMSRTRKEYGRAMAALQDAPSETARKRHARRAVQASRTLAGLRSTLQDLARVRD